jgi:hypothetical protein
MKNWKLSAVMAAATLAVAGGSAVAESQYGYDAAGTATVTAKGDLNIKVNVPKLVLLKIGTSSGTVDDATISGTFGTVPGGGATLADGSNVATDWDGTAPSFAAAGSSSPVQVRAWTNAIGGGSLAGTVQTAFPITGMDAMVTVANSAPAAGGSLVHPGANLATSTPTTFTRNTLVGSLWTFRISAANLLTLPAGSYSQLMRYTATTL